MSVFSIYMIIKAHLSLIQIETNKNITFLYRYNSELIKSNI